ncbi:MAG: DUF4959 domain-containing protein [Prevotellaceae bacterium]|nr:DUF4959 domain-containing protein [Prevotellaceae bacterium]
MKSLYYQIIAIAAGIMLSVSCGDDKVGQPPIDNLPPPPISNVTVEELPGGALITYELPNEIDISYVKGDFMFQGVKRTVRSSIYDNFVLVEGLGSVEPVEITLYLVDHSENVSEPVTKTFTPKTPPYKAILESMTFVPDFSGCNVSWVNPMGIEIGIFFFAANDEGVLEEIDLLFSPETEAGYTIRKRGGQFGTEERRFAVNIVDKWGNVSDTAYAVVAPFFEKILDKGQFLEVGLPFDNTSVNNNRPLRNIWDGSLTSIWHTIVGAVAVAPQFFTIDLGVEAKLSRFILWERAESYYYGQHNPQFFEVWATKELRTGMPDDYWWEDWKADWEMLGDYEVAKPSGSASTTVTADDKAFADAGFNFSFPLAGESAQYLRFVVKKTFANTLALHLNEINIYGSDGSEE